MPTRLPIVRGATSGQRRAGIRWLRGTRCRFGAGGPTVENSFTTLRIQVVLDVRGRANLLPQSPRELSSGAGIQAVPTAETWGLRNYRSLINFRPF